MLLDELRSDTSLSPFIKPDCCDNGICVDIDPSVLSENHLVIKVDEFYAHAVRTNDRPKTNDCLIVQRCGHGHFHWYLVELKNVQSQGRSDLNRDALWEKFHTCLTDFMSVRFRHYFYNLSYQYHLHLVLVAGKRSEKFNKNFDFKFLLGMKPLYFANKMIGIQGKNPNPLILPC